MVDLDGKRNGTTQPELEALFKEQLDAVVLQLKAEHQDAGYDNANLAQLLVQFLQFMEEVAGKNGTHKAQPKIPIKLFRDMRGNGPLFALAARIHQIKKLRDMTSIEFNNPQRRREHLEIYLNCRRELERLNMIQVPKVFIDSTCLPQDQSRMREVITRLGGHVAAAADEPGVTHHVFPFPASGDPDDGKVYLRVQEFRGAKALVHWWYLPDSYDEYLPREVVPDQLQPDPVPAGPCKVYIRWVYDSERFNEWMNPVDYETKEAQEEQEHAAADQQQSSHAGTTAAGGQAAGPAAGAGGEVQPASAPIPAPALPSALQQTGGVRGGSHHAGKRPPSPHRHDGHSGKRTRGADGHPALPEVAPGPGERLAPHVVRHVLQAPPKSVVDPSLPSENLSLGQRALALSASRSLQLAELQAGATATAAAAAPGPDSPPPPPQGRSPPRHGLRMGRTWFNMDSISECERQELPEFFNGRCASRTPRVYKDTRNFIVSKYRELGGGSKRLGFADIKDQLAGDTNSMHRIFEFLEEQGIINDTDAHAQGTQALQAPLPRTAFQKVMRRDGERRPHLLSRPDNCHEEGLLAAASGGNTFNLQTRKPMFNGDRSLDFASTVNHYCSVMPWVKCNDIRYHCTKLPNVDLCPAAFAEGRFPAGLCSKDFVRIDRRNPQLDESGWSGVENLLLLEALELFGDNWAQVAEHVGTKSQVQCILHFLQMPVDDLFISDLEGGLRSQPGRGSSQEASTLSSTGAPPFTSAGNPVMAQVSFLAAMVGPKVAATAASRALEMLGEQAMPLGSGEGDEADLSQVQLQPGMVLAAATSSLQAAAARARQLADQEDREMQRLVTAALQVQGQKVQTKLKYLASLNQVLEAEQTSLESVRAQHMAELLRSQRPQ